MNRETSEDILINCEGLSKKFCKDFKRSLWYGIKDVSLTFSNRGQHHNTLRKDEFWAVKNIDFELRRGDCLGLIGHNGAGKSTLLKILNGLIKPDEGQVTMRGRVGALIELGAGFNPVLTGRENIYNNGAVLGFSKAEISAKLETIIDFSELRNFIDMPVQNYSSGMKVRLGFAVAAQMEPDILLVDEVLAVGDLGFRLKCFKTIDEILPNTAIIFVSHSMPMVSRICNKVILMDGGVAKYHGTDVSKAIDLYYTRFASNTSNIVIDDKSIVLESLKVLIHNSIQGNKLLNWGEDLVFELKFQISKADIKNIDIVIIIQDKEQRPVAAITERNFEIKNKKKYHLKFTNQSLQLSKGSYSVSLVINVDESPAYRQNDITSFQVTHDRDTWEPFLLKTKLERL